MKSEPRETFPDTDPPQTQVRRTETVGDFVGIDSHRLKDYRLRSALVGIGRASSVEGLGRLIDDDAIAISPGVIDPIGDSDTDF